MNRQVKLVVLHVGLDGLVGRHGVAGEDADEAGGDLVATHRGDARDLLGCLGDDGGNDALGNAYAGDVELALGHVGPPDVGGSCPRDADSAKYRRCRTDAPV